MLIVFGIAVFAGMNVYRTILYQAAVLTGTCLLFSFFSGLRPFRIRFKITRIEPSQIAAGDDFSYEVEIVNLSDILQKGLVLYEEVHDPRPTADELLNTPEPGEHLRNVWDRKVLYFRWQWLIRKNSNFRMEPVKLPDLVPGKPVRVKICARSFVRGYVRLKGVTLARPDLFGFFQRTVFIELSGNILVLPSARKVDLQFDAVSRHYQPGGIQMALSIGNSDEFMSLRHYRPGDPLRHIHWKSFAKTGDLVIREFEDEFFQRKALVLDTAVPFKDRDLFEEAVKVSAYLIPFLKTRDGVVDLLIAGDPPLTLSTGRGLGSMDKMMAVLACVEQCPDLKTTDIVPAIRSRLAEFSGVVCIFSGWNKGHKEIYDLLKTSRTQFHMLVTEDETSPVEAKIKQDIADMSCIRIVRHLTDKGRPLS